MCNTNVIKTKKPCQKNQTGTKAVRISTDATNSVRAAFYQIYNGSEQVLEFKTFATIKNAEKWANNKLN